MSYLMFQNMLRQQKKEDETFTHAFNTKQRNTPIIGRLFIDNEIIPITDIKYEKINKKNLSRTACVSADTQPCIMFGKKEQQ